jgi:ankyrin repeat protein
MCRCIANVDKSLVGARNHDNETPFFLAAFYGKKEAFLCLHELCGTKNVYNYCRRKDGDTILHCAISGDYFGEYFNYLKCMFLC